MKYKILIFILTIGVQLIAQPYIDTSDLKIYNADELLTEAKIKGISWLEEKINPIDLVYLDSSYASTIINLEFESGFFNKHHSNDKVKVYGLPKVTIELAETFSNDRAGSKLFNYYKSLPKFTESDTIFSIYNNLDDFLKVLVKYNPEGLIEKLKIDYNEWNEIAMRTPSKSYPTIDEMRSVSFKESMKFKASDLIVDCNFLVLQIAGALNYLKVKGFEDSLIEELKNKQTWPFAQRYFFPEPLLIDEKNENGSRKTIKNTSEIKDFNIDYKKVEKIILDNYENCCDSKLVEIIEQDFKGYLTMSHNNGYDSYIVKVNTNIITIELISSIIE